MSKYNSASIRQRVIDKCLGSLINYSTKDLMDACNEELLFQGEHPVTSMNTIRNDLENISSTYPEAVIVSNKVGKNIYYSYKDKGYSIYKIPFNDEELAYLTQTITLLSRFEGMPQFDWISNFKEKFKSTIHFKETDQPVVGFDENIDLVGRNCFFLLFSAILNRQVLRLEYKNFKKKQQEEYIIHPYYLKQYNKRWYVMAYTEEYKNISIYAFDRIVSMKPIHKKYIVNTKYNFNEYFDDMIGVTKYEKTSIKPIKLWISSERWPYIETKPLHGTQKIISKDNTGTVIQIKVFINNELEQLILSFGKDIKVIEPESLQKKISDILSDACKNYK